MKRPVLAANWKMNTGPAAAADFGRAFLAGYPAPTERTILFFPPALAFQSLSEEMRGRADILLGVQNIHWESKGAFTGETSAELARDAGARITLVGHSERRHVFGETDEECALKCAAAERAGIVPMLCVGEKIEDREGGRMSDVILRQLRTGLSRLARPSSTEVLIAYEPVWAIGTGHTATPADAMAAHEILRDELRTIVGERAEALPILYGGSVSPLNSASLLAASGVDGLLVGGASLDPATWLSIVRA